VARVLPDVVAIDKEFDYIVPEAFEATVRVGTVVRVVLAGRRVGGWVTALDVEPPPGVALSPLARVSGWGPPAELIDLSGWAAWRWAGHRAHFLRSASPPGAVRTLPAAASTRRPPPRTPGAPAPGAPAPAEPVPGGPTPVIAEAEMAALSGEALAGGRRVLQLPPAADPTPVVVAAAALGPTLVLVPAVARAAVLARRLRRDGLGVALLPDDWALARAGVDVVVGARAAAWAPCPSLAAVVVVDGHDEAYQQQSAPTWDAVEVVGQRARRAGVPCVVISATPTLDLAHPAGQDGGVGPQSAALVVRPSQSVQRRGWAPLEVIDRRSDDPRLGLWSAPLARAIAQGGRVACVLNRRGRARLLACAACGELVRCERCGASLTETADVDTANGETAAVDTAVVNQAVVNQAVARRPARPQRRVSELSCPHCATTRPGVCLACGSSALKRLRVGVTRAAEELSALVGRPVSEVSGPGAGTEAHGELLMGTEAVLHRVGPLDLVAFVDFDQELLAPRYRAGEDALGMLGRAARLVGGRRRGGRILVQTRLPEHPALLAALLADYERWAQPERELRAALRLPPSSVLARVSGEGAAAYVAGLQAASAGNQTVQILGPAEGQWLLKAATATGLSDLLAKVARPVGQRLRVEVGPRRV